MKSVVLGLCAAFSSVAVAESDWRTSWDGTQYGYASNTKLRGDSVLNPSNQVGHLVQNNYRLDARFNFKAENELFRFTARPIAVQGAHNGAMKFI
jgi:hypothetical protein